ncbi:hypothetical protein TNCV_3918631 [Trichonephila clavipes]|nr:hypothetical protein TNCV_3918631 [Trichonephila clavipes]
MPPKDLDNKLMNFQRYVPSWVNTHEGGGEREIVTTPVMFVTMRNEWFILKQQVMKTLASPSVDVSDRGIGLRCMPVVSCSFEHHAGDNTIWLGSTPISERTSGGGQRPPNSLPLPPTSRENLQLDGYSEYPMPQRHYTFTNIHAFSRI